ncbi:D-beta-hydroxybutyrate dehydrogenase [Salmonella enterica subsp. enterica serovar Typhi]|uniref:D-beta-hydroxybutyrate dehydrogenase n=8 Tax=Salmonella enterica TaxID=28901 RepID=A0A725VJ74_SALEP|nr:D-beta-hydroxybutyrate dehydrogenase [Salmonella enterica subsp. enterica serovar Typhi str. Ty21a]AXR57100.1 3-hydroxyisobutyrate dehydrogenase domain protein [Salmonella enterica subsp. enterica serovar Typhi]EAB2822752.1 D-beta-hydroxybutyrate dehydrogenase [Salmonella enterica]EBB4505894.1 D-beta-hydroxybutyrate dehydrogenase [Salmonella enterica subsp. enterica serovar Typhimurium]EBH2513165.1 D-beta-hydroxybutyrate dehydrogenase [Salmonella enterica subsp. enterica serovar Enteritidis]
MASGREAAFTRLKPVLDAVASNVYRISDTPGAGARALRRYSGSDA